MRDLLFNVKKQSLSKNEKCDFSNIIKGSENYLNCCFTFDSDWNGVTKVVVFEVGSEYEVCLLHNNSCFIPSRFKDKDKMTVRVVGQKGDQKISTNRVELVQDNGEIKEVKKKWQK